MSNSTGTIARVLAKTSLFHGISPTDIENLVGRAKTLEIPAGCTVFSEGELVSGLYVVTQGSVQIQKPKGTTIADVEKGSFFGEISLFGQTISATATVGSEGGCTAVNINRVEMDLWFSGHPEIEAQFFRNLSVELCGRLMTTTDHLSIALIKK